MRRGLKRLFFAATVGTGLLAGPARGQDYAFSWDRATIYEVVTDWFANGDPANDGAARSAATAGSVISSGAGFGGDLAGLTEKVQSDYFTLLGVDVLSISAAYPDLSIQPQETDGVSFASIWPHDYTAIDPGLGSADAFQEFVDAAHSKGIRVVMRVSLPPSDLALRLDSTDAGTAPELSEILGSRWAPDRVLQEMEALKHFYARSGYPKSARTAAVKWLSDWVLRFGLDGFQITVDYGVDWRDVEILKAEAVSALRTWKGQHAERSVDELDFWLSAHMASDAVASDVLSVSGVDAAPGRPPDLGAWGIDSTFSVLRGAFITAAGGAQPARIHASESIRPFVGQARDAATKLLLLPGSVQILYGDEMTGAHLEAAAGKDVAGRGPVNWDEADAGLVSHWNRLGTFRKRHPAVAGGTHEKMSDEPYAFYRGMRLGASLDEVIVVLDASGRVRLNVSRVFPDDTVLREAYTGKVSIVSFGEVEFNAGESGVLLIEPVH